MQYSFVTRKNTLVTFIIYIFNLLLDTASLFLTVQIYNFCNISHTYFKIYIIFNFIDYNLAYFIPQVLLRIDIKNQALKILKFLRWE